jgi:hypothetical protein
MCTTSLGARLLLLGRPFPPFFLSCAGGAEDAMQRQSYMQQGYHQQATGVLRTAGMCWVKHIARTMPMHSIW